MPKQKIAMPTAGGLAPCLSSAVAELIGRYSELVPDVEIIGYLGGYRALLKGESAAVTVPRPRNTDDLLMEASTNRPVARCHRASANVPPPGSL
jgi:6-phosphofructokinase